MDTVTSPCPVDFVGVARSKSWKQVLVHCELGFLSRTFLIGPHLSQHSFRVRQSGPSEGGVLVSSVGAPLGEGPGGTTEPGQTLMSIVFGDVPTPDPTPT